jgi:hypothetical protein
MEKISDQSNSNKSKRRMENKIRGWVYKIVVPEKPTKILKLVFSREKCVVDFANNRERSIEHRCQKPD